MRIVEYNGLKYEINLEELNQLKKDSSRPKGVKLQEGWTNAIDVMIKIWDNGGKELFLYVAKKLIEKVIKNRKPLD